jgi:hypothetical protein
MKNQNNSNENTQVKLMRDPELKSLKLEITILESEIAVLESERSQIEKVIYLFEVRYDKILGSLILQILELRKNRLRKEKIDDPVKDSEYHEAEKDYQDFKESYSTLKEEIPELTSEEQNELILTFRKASKLCHPDIVADEQKEIAQKVFIELKKAYDKNDLKRIKEIYNDLLKGIFVLLGAEVNEKQKLLSIIAEFRFKRDKYKCLLLQLKENETYLKIQQIDDWDKYFKRKQKELTEILNEEKSFYANE